MSGNSRTKEFEAAWWTARQTTGDQFRNFAAVDEAMAWLREQETLHGWIIRRRSTDGWRTVASGTAADLHR